MKNKLGTRQLPTAELLLDGTEAVMVGEESRGIANISSMLTITRLSLVRADTHLHIQIAQHHSSCWFDAKGD